MMLTPRGTYAQLPDERQAYARTYVSALIIGASGTGKTPIVINTFPGAVVVDADGTIAQYKDARVLLVPNATHVGLNAVISDIENGLLKTHTLAIDDFSRIIAEVEWELAEHLKANAYYRAMDKRVETLMRRLLALPCNLIVTAHERPAKPTGTDEVVAGFIAAPDDATFIPTEPDLPRRLESYFNLSIRLYGQESSVRAKVRKSLYPSVPQATKYTDLHSLCAAIRELAPPIAEDERDAHLVPVAGATRPAPARTLPPAPTAATLTPPHQPTPKAPEHPPAQHRPTEDAKPASVPTHAERPVHAARPATSAPTKANTDPVSTHDDELRNKLSIIRELNGTDATNLRDYLIKRKIYRGGRGPIADSPETFTFYAQHMDEHIATLRNPELVY
jgi:hypothetical protein